MAEAGKATGKKTQANREVYETPDGKMVSEWSTTLEHKGKWVNVPTIHNGYSYDDEILRMMLDAEVIQPTSTHKSRDDAIKAAVDRSKSLKFNEGGAVTADLDSQTEELFQGGTTDQWRDYVDTLKVDIPEVSFKDAATFVASVTPIIGDAMAAKDVYDELQKDEPNYYLAGALGGAALVGLVPGLGDAAAKAIKKGAKEVFDVAKRVEVDPNAMGSGLGNVKLKPKEPFKKTRSAYRIATQSEDGKLYPLFVNASDEIPVGEWISASVPPVTFKGANGNMYVPSKGAARSKGEKSKATGDMQTIPDAETADKLREAGFSVEKPSKSAPYGKVRAVASRPGFHATTKPVAHHLGPEDLIITSSERDQLLKAGVTPKAFKAKTFNYLDGKLISKKKVAELSPEDKKKVKSQKKYYVKRRAEDQVFVEVDMADDTSQDLLKYMQERGRTDINDKLPSGGSYTYQDGQADAETWVVGGDMKVNRVLSREEAKAAQEAAGVKDLPYRSEIEEILGRKFAKGGLVGEENMYTGQQDSLIATGMADDPMRSEEDQTVKAFALGGLAEDVDPVSGNEVPIGSMPEEVRDDIPAQLSEGEYVVPADVVRYYGVKFFEDLRNDAKMGFSQMQANGRIGGEPIGMEVVEPQDDLDIMFEDSDFEVVDGYAEGGVVGAASDILSGQAGGLMEYRLYKNPAGEEITIMFFNGMPMSLIPEGYVPVVTDTDIAEAEAAEAGNVAASSAAEQQPVYAGQAQPSGGDSDDTTVADMPKPVSVNYKELTPDELRDMVKQGQELAPRTMPLIAGLLNPFAGLAVKAAMWHQATQVENELARRLKEEDLSEYDKTFYEDLLEIQRADKPSLADKLFKDQSEAEEVLGRDYLSPAQQAAKAVDAQVDAEAIDTSVRAAFAGEMPTGMDPIADPEPIELTSLNDEPGARDYKGPFTPTLDTKGGTPEPYVYKPEAPAVTTPESDNASAFLASEDAVIADQRRDTINKLMAEKKAEREAKIAEIAAQIAAKERAIAAAQAQASAQASLAAAASSANNDNDTSTYETAMANARAAAATRERNISAGLGAQTKKGSLAGSKSGYFD